MDVDFSATDSWTAAWLLRTCSPLRYYTYTFFFLLSFISIFVGLHSLTRMYRAYRGIEHADLSTSAAICTTSNKCTRDALKLQSKIASAYCFHVWLILTGDAMVCLSLIYKHHSLVGSDENVTIIPFRLAVFAASTMLAIIVTIAIFPLLQLLAMAWWLRKFPLKNNMEATLDHGPQVRVVRILATYMYLLWAMAGFAFVAFVPATWNGPVRIILVTVVAASAVAWGQLSCTLLYDPDVLAEFVRPSTRDVILIFAKHSPLVPFGNRVVDALSQPVYYGTVEQQAQSDAEEKSLV